MIVVCTRCQAKFRVADEKVGPRGAKVRCSKCQDVFLVHRDLGSVPLGADGRTSAAAAPPPPPPPPRPAGVELDLEPGRQEGARTAIAPPAPDPFAGDDPFAASVAPPRSPAVPSPAEDPFLAASQAAPAAASLTSTDPFAAAMAGPDPSAADPFGDALASFSRPDPFAAPPAMTPAPMAPTPAPVAPPGALPLTDLSDLMGPQPVPEPDGETSDPDFALDGRAAPRPRVSALEAATEAAEVNVAAAAASRQEHSFYADMGEESLALATEETGRRPVAPPPPPADAPTPVHGSQAVPVAEAPARPRARAPAAAAAQAELAAETLAQHLPRLRRASRLRKIALNALALVVLVIVATALLILWRSGGKLEPGALRPSAILRALGGRPLGAFAAVDVASGAYERAKGPPLLFVRGRAVSRADASVRGMVVSVEVVRRGEVVARGQALAGAVPTPEELAAVTDAAALAVLARAAEARAPAQVNPGEEVPFLVAISDYPQDVTGAALRLQVAEAPPGGGP